jgi:hypothetical protein
MSTDRVVTIIPDEQHVITELCNLIGNVSKQAIEKDDLFKVGLSGIYYFQIYNSLNILKYI